MLDFATNAAALQADLDVGARYCLQISLIHGKREAAAPVSVVMLTWSPDRTLLFGKRAPGRAEKESILFDESSVKPLWVNCVRRTVSEPLVGDFDCDSTRWMTRTAWEAT